MNKENEKKEGASPRSLQRLVSCDTVRDGLAYGGVALAGIGSMFCTLGFVLNRPAMSATGAAIIPVGVLFYAIALRELNRVIAELKSANDKMSGRAQ